MGNSRVQVIKAKTGDYTVASGDFGGLITNTGATGAVTITLPAAATTTPGAWVDVYATAAQNLTVATATVDTLVVDGDATADSISWQTSSHIIGNGARFIANTTNWLCVLHAAATTTTIATQTIAT